MKLYSNEIVFRGHPDKVCEQIDRECYTMEYDPKYVDVIIDRWEKYTGRKAVKVE